jgi:hypothetical protein
MQPGIVERAGESRVVLGPDDQLTRMQEAHNRRAAKSRGIEKQLPWRPAIEGFCAAAPEGLARPREGRRLERDVVVEIVAAGLPGSAAA